MSRRTRRAAILIACLAVAGLGLGGVVSYAQDYDLHRGFSALVPFKRAGTGQLEQVDFYSRALGRQADYLVYLPPHYSTARHYPTYYLLHGSPGKPQVFVDIANMDVRLDNQMSLGASRPMILVYPDGRIDGSTYSDSEWANTPSGNYMGYVLNVVSDVDHRFSAIRNRSARVIAGFSAGAFGAVNIALHNLSTFANVQSWSGYFTETPTAVFTHASATSLAFNSPIDYIQRIHARLRRYPLRAYLFVGRDDSSAVQQAPMIRQLRAAGVSEQSALYPGGHDWGVWYPRLNAMLALASFDVAHPPHWAGALTRRPTTPAVHHTRPAPHPAAAPAPAHRRHHPSELRLIASLLLALFSAALINLGFVLQHRGHHHVETGQDPPATARPTFLDPTWLTGQAVGWLGFAGQVVAVALAPLTLVQAFSAGSLALSVPVAAAAFGYRVDRRQAVAIGLIGLSLASLPIGFGADHGHLRPGLLILAALLTLIADAAIAWRGRRASATAAALLAGAFYGVADGAIKAESLGLRFHHDSILSGWTLLACLCTLGGFLAFQTALSRGDAVRPLSLMNACTALAAIALGVVAFGEPLGSGPAATLGHLAAICVVFICARPLAGTSETAVDGPVPTPAATAAGPTPTHPVRLRARLAGAGVPVAVLLGCAITIGLLYVLRQSALFRPGPRVRDALPLLQLAGFDAQPLARILAAALAAGLVLGVLLMRIDRRRRVPLVGVCALTILLGASDASTALAQNLRFTPLALHLTPGLGAWLEAACLTLASAIPGPRPTVELPRRLSGLVTRRVAGTVLGAGGAAILAVALLAPSGEAAAGPRHRRATVAERTGRATTVTGAAVILSPAREAALRRAHLDAAFDHTLTSARLEYGAPGATAAIDVCGRPLWAGASGVADRSSGAPMTDHSLFILNSAVKTVVATMVMQEVRAGHLTLQTRLSRFYPSLPDAHRITVRMLLTMTSGLPEYLDAPAVARTVRNHPRYAWSTRELLTALGRGLGRVDFTPGSRYEYSDTNYIALGGILRKVTHASVQTDFERLIAGPLRLHGASWDRTPAATAELARPYLHNADGTLRSPWIPGYGPAATVWGPVFTDGGLAISSADLARFAAALLDGRLLPLSTVAEMIHMPADHYGFGIRGKTYDNLFWIGHGGAYGGYDAEDWSLPARHLTMAVSANVQGGPGGLASNLIWQKLVLTALRITPAHPRCSTG